MLAGFIIAFVLGSFVMKVLQRLKGDYLILAFFGVQLGGIGIIHNWIPVTDGPFGIYNIPKPSVGSLAASSYFEFLIVVWAVVFIVYFISIRLVHSQFGIILRSIREDEIVTHAWGKNVSYFKCIVFGFGSAMASLAGGLYASYSTYIHPSNFGLDVSILVFALIVIGGLGAQVGPLLGSLLVVLMPEFFRIIGLPYSIAAFVQQLLYGVLLVSLLAFRPEGLVGKFKLG
jgi:branched-chain amino acid transport system permease protein